MLTPWQPSGSLDTMPSKASFSDQIRAAIDASGRSRHSICEETGIDRGAMSRFMSGQGGMLLDNIDRIAALLGWTLVPGPRKRSRRRRKPL
jgi:transcriptional regulator with XRE-family HTH domain